jgi:hypothetical protein
MLAWAGVAHAQTLQLPAFQNLVLRNSFNPSGAGARGLGMGGAFIAVADDGTAASFNPAGLTQLRRSELALVGFGDRLESSSTLLGEPFGDPVKTDHYALDFAGLAVPFDVGGKTLTVQLSYQRAVDLFGEGRAAILGAFFLGNDIAAFAADVNPKQKGAFHTASLSTAYQVTERLSLGATLNYWIANWNASGTGQFRVLLPGFDSPVVIDQTSFSQDQDFTAFNANVGFLLKYPKLSIGGVMRLPFGAEYNLHETGLDQDFLENKETVIDNTMRTTLHWPWSAGAGIAIRPVKGLTLAADYTSTRWSRTYLEAVPGGVLQTDQPFDAEGNPVETYVDRNFFDLLPASVTKTQNTNSWRTGGEYLIVTSKVVIPLRGGIYRDESPVPQFNEGGRKIDGFTFGTGINFDRIVFDVAYEHRKSEGPVGALTGEFSSFEPPREKVKEQRIVASLIYRFGGAGGEDPVKKFFHGIFAGPKED